MPETPSDRSDQPASATRPSGWWVRLRVALPFVVTALAAVVLSLLIQAELTARQITLVALPTARPTLTVMPASPTRVVPVTPLPTPPLPDERILSQEILDLQIEMDRVWSAYFLLRAANQLSDAEDALLTNELDEVERLLVTIKVSLDQAYELSSEQNKGPVGEFRTRLSTIREDLRIRPEGIDQRLQRLRQDVLSLVDEGG